MINQSNETLLSLTDAAKAVPPIDGKRPHVSTLWRWCRKGVRGTHLEYVRLGNRVCTTAEAIARFTHRLAEADEPIASPATTPQPKGRSLQQRERDIENAERQLDAAGI
jgi:Protein of unknown function (DUF1580)